jgi:hypothetical protein
MGNGIKVMFISGMHVIGNLVKKEGDWFVFEWVLILASSQGSYTPVPYWMNMAQETVHIRCDAIDMIADATEEMKKQYNEIVINLKAGRSDIVLAPASTLKEIEAKKSKNNIQKLI